MYEDIWVLKVKVISWPWPKVVDIQNSNWIFSETTVLILTKLCMKAFRFKEIKIWWHDARHIIKMAAMPKCGKNPSKIFSRTGRLISTKPVMYNWGLQPIIVCSNNDPGVTLTYFTARSNLVTEAFLWEKVKTVDFSENIAASQGWENIDRPGFPMW